MKRKIWFIIGNILAVSVITSLFLFVHTTLFQFIKQRSFQVWNDIEKYGKENWEQNWYWYVGLSLICVIAMQLYIYYVKTYKNTKNKFKSILWLYNQIDRTGNKKEFNKRFRVNEKTKPNWIISSSRHNAYLYDKDQNAVVIGGSGSGKTQRVLIPSIVENANLKALKPNMIVIDLKGEILKFTGSTLVNNNYKIISINLENTEESEQWNPLSLIYSTYESGNKKLAIQMINDIIENLNWGSIGNSGSVWKQQAKQLVMVVTKFILFVANDLNNKLFKKADFNFTNINKWISIDLFKKDKQKRIETTLNTNFGEHWSDLKTQYMQLKDIPDETFAGYIMNAGEAIQHFLNNESIKKITSSNEGINLQELVNYKGNWALFLRVPDHKTSTHALMPLLIDQIYELLIDKANSSFKGELSTPVQFYLDEFGNTPKINNFDNKISICRQRKVFFMLVLQDTEQLSKYNDGYGENKGKTIQANCGIQYFISSNNQNTLEEVSKSLGKAKITKTSTLTRDNKTQTTKSESEELVLSVQQLKSKKSDNIIIQLMGDLPLYIKSQMAYKIYKFDTYIYQKLTKHEQLNVDINKEHQIHQEQDYIKIEKIDNSTKNEHNSTNTQHKSTNIVENNKNSNELLDTIFKEINTKKENKNGNKTRNR